LPVLWIVSTVLLCAVFAFAAAPRAEAESAEDSRRYALIIQNVFDFIQRHYVDEVQASKLYEGAMKGMFEASVIPHRVFLPASDMADLSDTTQGSFGGVGLYITKRTEPGKSGAPLFVEVASPIEDTPGWRAGISPGDLIIEIDGESTEKLTMDEVLARLRGKPGTDVTILIRRGEKLEFPVKLTRAVIEVPTVKSAMIGADVGYVKIITFTPMTAERVGAALDTFKKSGTSRSSSICATTTAGCSRRPSAWRISSWTEAWWSPPNPASPGRTRCSPPRPEPSCPPTCP
jgi:carboxyl-terminal processing protease